MVKYETEWCAREDLTKWCRQKKREFTGLGGAYLGVAGCYRPDDCTICLGKEAMVNTWMRQEEDVSVRFLTGVLCHEEDHRIIHEVTGSAKCALCFDYLLGYPFDFEANMEYFRIGSDIDPFWGGKLTPYGKIVLKKLESNKTDV